ncbi:MAG: acyltransferase [Nocardioides sp.]|nr:acyltransferase [Nocardioides sp.]
MTRDPWLDNAKMTLVTLVVVGHAWVMLPDGPVVDQVYDWLYFWHMPAFILVTGYLAKKFEWSGARLAVLVRTVVVPYLVFEAALVLFRTQLGGETFDDVFLDPHWPVWFLAALALWRLATPLFRAVPAPVAVAVAVALSVASGFVGTHVLDLFRVLGFLPFFVLGLVLRAEHLELLRHRAVQVVGVGVLAVALLSARFFGSWAGTDWVYYNSSYSDLGVSGAEGVAIRLAMLGIGLATALSFLALVPRVGGWFTRMGAATLVVYLFHGFFVKGAGYAGFDDWAAGHVVPAAVLVVVLGTALGLALASPPVVRVLENAVDPFGAARRPADEALRLHAVASTPYPTLDELVGADGAGEPGRARSAQRDPVAVG